MDGCQIRRDPLGAVLIIGAFNYPVQLTLMPICGALAGGNVVVATPSESSGASAKLMGDLVAKYMDPAVVQYAPPSRAAECDAHCCCAGL